MSSAAATYAASVGSGTFRRVVCNRISPDFAKCTEVATFPIPTLAEIKPTDVLVRNRFVGINASDINYTNGKYRPGVNPPFNCGMEAIGEVVACGSSVTQPEFQPGSAVIVNDFGAFSEYQRVPTRFLRRVPRVDPKLLALEISGTTASICLEQVAHPIQGETALVTAAAGGTGVFAVQLLKKVYGCKVIGTCSSESKSDFLKNKLHCDEVINYTKENVSEVLSKRKGGVNLVYESVGGNMLDAALENIAIKGRIITIGGITAYSSGGDWAEHTVNAAKIPQILLSKSASLRGFFLMHYKKLIDPHFFKLLEMVDKGELDSCVDETKKFVGVDEIAAAVAHLHSRANIGKVVVELP
jgi:prostaglandin reductase 3